MFSWKGSRHENACFAFLPLNKCKQSGAAHCGGFSLAEVADL